MSFGESWRFDGDLAVVEELARTIARRAQVDLRIDRPVPSLTTHWRTGAGKTVVIEVSSRAEDGTTDLSAYYIAGDNEAVWQLTRELVVDVALMVGAELYTDPDDEQMHCASLPIVLDPVAVVSAARRVAAARGLRFTVIEPVPAMTSVFVVPRADLERCARRLDRGADISDIDPPWDETDHYELAITACGQDGEHPPELQLESNEYDNRAAWSAACVFASELAQAVGAQVSPDIDEELFQMLLTVPKVAKKH